MTKNITYEMKTITPTLAEKFLKKNYSKNRLIRKSYVSFWVNLLKRGEFKLTHQGIAFGTDGLLYDGQHRLSAIIESGIPARMTIAYNVPPESFVAFDQGLVRTVADIYNIPKKVAEVANLAWLITRTNKGVRKTPQQAYPFIVALQPPVLQLLNYCNTNAAFFSSAQSKLAAVLWVLETPEDKNDIFNLYKNLVLNNFSELPPIGLAIKKLTFKTKFSCTGSQAQSRNLAIMIHVFQKENRMATKIVMPETRKNEKIAWAKMILDDAVSDLSCEDEERKQRLSL